MAVPPEDVSPGARRPRDMALLLLAATGEPPRARARDQQADRAGLALLLQAMGHATRTAYDSQDALDATVERIVAAIVESGPQAVRDQKALVADWERLPLDQAIQRGIKVLAAAWRTEEPKRMTAQRLKEMRRRRS